MLRSAASSASFPVERGAFKANAALLWALILGVIALQAVILPWSRLSVVSSPKLSFNICVCSILAMVGIFVTFRDFRPRLALISSSFSQLVVASIALCLLTYSVTALASSTPLRDDVLATIDGYMGFHWPVLLLWSDSHPVLADLARVAYTSIAKQAIVAVLVLGFRRDCRRLQGAVYAYLIALSLTSAMAYLVPATGAYAFFGVQSVLHQHITLQTADTPVAEILGLRDHHLTSFDLRKVEGIISFPSFHAALGVLFIWCFWPVSGLRWVAAALNLAMIASTPLHGSHYLTDVLVGLVIGIVAVCIAGRLHAAVGRRLGPAMGKSASADLVRVAHVVPLPADVTTVQTGMGDVETFASA